MDWNWNKQRTLYTWVGPSAHRRGKIRMWRREFYLARGTFQVLGKMWSSEGLSMATKICKLCMYETLVLCTLLYNAETWTLKQKQKQRLRVLEMACLRRLEGVRKRDKIRSEEIYSRLNIRCGIIDRIQNGRLRCLGDMPEMQDERYPKRAC